jgi:hypothetical protein
MLELCSTAFFPWVFCNFALWAHYDRCLCAHMHVCASPVSVLWKCYSITLLPWQVLSVNFLAYNQVDAVNHMRPWYWRLWLLVGHCFFIKGLREVSVFLLFLQAWLEIYLVPLLPSFLSRQGWSERLQMCSVIAAPFPCAQGYSSDPQVTSRTQFHVLDLCAQCSVFFC